MIVLAAVRGRLVMLIAYSKIVVPSTISCATAVTLWLKIFFVEVT